MAEIRALIVDGMTSGSGSEMDADYFERLRGRVAGGAEGA